MFKKLLTFLFCSVMALSAKAQFSIDEDTLYVYNFAGKTSAEFVDIYTHTVIRSKTSMPETIVWQRIVNNLPDTNWQSAICDIVSCRPPEIGYDSFTFVNGGDTGILSFHFYVKNIAGTGKMVVRFKRSSVPMDYVDVVINITAWDPLSVRNLNEIKTNIYPNPTKDFVHVSCEQVINAKLVICDVQGRQLFSSDFNQHTDIDTRSFSPGMYFIRLIGDNGTVISNQTLIVE